ncbi:MAG: ABC transporter ATP-binding protein [Acidobacteria bacterium]|nr:ABC transporter ATP-binding protein [Acidobacteriota bacterium]
MIKCEDLYKAFGSKVVLAGANLEIKEGESMTVIGGSGVGKSVLIKNIIGLLKPDKGKIWVENTLVNDLNESDLRKLRMKFGMLFQYAALFDSLSVGENVAFALNRHTKLSQKEIKDRVTDCLNMVGLFGVEHLFPAELSGGMKKRVGLARAIAMRPKILLYDEPTTGLDPIMADAINNLIIRLKEKLQVTSITITHDMVSAYKISDRIAMLYEGKIIEVGTPGEIKKSQNPYVKQFVTGSAEGPIKTVSLEGI